MGFRIIYLDNPLDQIEDNETWDLLQKCLRLRVIGYRKEHAITVLPLGKDDFFSTQILIFDDSDLVCTYKFTRYDLCLRHKVPFPMIQALEEGGIREYSPLLNSIVKQAQEKNHQISYCGGWAIHPEARENKVYSRQIRDMVAISHHHYLKSFNIDESLIFGVIKFKAHLFQEHVGYKRIEDRGKPIGEVGLSYLDFEPVYMLHLTETSEEVKKLCNENQSILDSAKFYTADSTTLNNYRKIAA
jgi:hypothetical protein